MTGRGSIIQRCRHEIEEGRGDRRSIVLTSIPYQVGKAGLVEKIAEAAKDKRIEGVSQTFATNPAGSACAWSSTSSAMRRPRSRSTRCGATRPRNRASRRTCWRSAAVGPKCWAARHHRFAFVQFREQVITRRTKFELNKARTGRISCSGWSWRCPTSTKSWRSSAAPPIPRSARGKLLAKEWPIGEIAQYIRLVEAIEPNAEQEGGTYRLSEEQVKAILDLRLHRLTALGRDEIGDELKELATAIEEYLAILATGQSSTR
jgi:DNA gyrase subunit A